MIKNIPVMSSIKFCPVCGTEMKLKKTDDKLEMACTSHSCLYHEHPSSAKVVTLISLIAVAYAKSKGVETVNVLDKEFSVDHALRPDALLPLIVSRAKSMHKLSGMSVYRGFEFPLMSITDTAGLTKHRVVYDTFSTSHSIHIAAICVTDSLDELLFLTQKHSKKLGSKILDFDLYRSEFIPDNKHSEYYLNSRLLEGHPELSTISQQTVESAATLVESEKITSTSLGIG